jgi:3-deoxy-manno-octulosonate cytidylyltransferase (CMP-KDO synthetase)
MANPIVIIPARMASTRLPGKPLADIHGEPMIAHVWRRAVEADVGPVLVAADEPAIIRAIERLGGRAILTRADHASGSDRTF